MRILLTGANAPGTSGTAFSLKQSGLFNEPIMLLGGDQEGLEFSPYLERVTKLPNGRNPSYEHHISKLCEQEKIQLVIPQTTTEASYFYETRNRNRNFKVSILEPRGGDFNLNSKIQTYSLVESLGLCAADFSICTTFEELQRFATDHQDRNIFVKADELSGGRGILRIVKDRSAVLEKSKSYHDVSLDEIESLFKILNTGSGVVAQTESVGIEYSIDCFRDEFVNIAVPRTRDVVRAGVSQKTTVRKNEKLTHFARRFGDALDLRGVYGLQCFLSESGEISFLECNPRVQGTMVASTLAGENLIGRAARLAMGLPSLPEKEIAWGTVFMRTWSGVGIFQGVVIEI